MFSVVLTFLRSPKLVLVFEVVLTMVSTLSVGGEAEAARRQTTERRKQWSAFFQCTRAHYITASGAR